MQEEDKYIKGYQNAISHLRNILTNTNPYTHPQFSKGNWA